MAINPLRRSPPEPAWHSATAGRGLLRVLPPVDAIPHADALLSLRPGRPRPAATGDATLLVAGLGTLATLLVARRGRRRLRREAAAVRERALTELRAAVERRDAALDAAAHELRTPLTAVLGQAQLLHRRAQRLGTPEAARLVASAAGIASAGTRVAGLVDALVKAARLDLEPDFEWLFDPTSPPPDGLVAGRGTTGGPANDGKATAADLAPARRGLLRARTA